MENHTDKDSFKVNNNDNMNFEKFKVNFEECDIFIVCGNCREEIKIDEEMLGKVKYCFSCSSDISKKMYWLFYDKSKKKFSNGCPDCHTVLSADSKFCGGCGFNFHTCVTYNRLLCKINSMKEEIKEVISDSGKISHKINDSIITEKESKRGEVSGPFIFEETKNGQNDQV